MEKAIENGMEKATKTITWKKQKYNNKAFQTKTYATYIRLITLLRRVVICCYSGIIKAWL